jgi:hypothetical protein
MKIAIHDRPGSFSSEWINYCKNHDIQFKLVNCYDSDIIKQLKTCDGLLWHWSQDDSKAILFARQLTYSLEQIGIKVFPNSKTCWHFDDKLGQKYLLEAIGAPLVSSYIFYDRREAIRWAKHTIFPKVFKLRGGAGSVNVKLIKSVTQAKRYINKAFRLGFLTTDTSNSLKDRCLRLRKEKDINAMIHLFKGFARIFIPKYDDKIRNREKGYIYLQDFIADNSYDIRVIIIGNRAIAIKRLVRQNDFRASGSGRLIFNKDEIPLESVRSAFLLAEQLKTQCLAFDFLYDKDHLLLMEISYGFLQKLYYQCPGFWDRDLLWHPEDVKPEWFIIEDFLSNLN